MYTSLHINQKNRGKSPGSGGRPFFTPAFVQPKLSVNTPGDKYEQEADAVADQVMRLSGPGLPVQRMCRECGEEEELQRKPLADSISTVVQRKPANGDRTLHPAAENFIRSKSGSGSPMPGDTRGWMEQRFGTDFSDVRIHTDHNAALLSRKLNAEAFTHGREIYFNKGNYAPETEKGKRLLAHELTHVVQQSSQTQPDKIQKQTDDSIESGTGVGQGIRDGTMSGDAIMGQTYTATCSFSSYDIKFTFSKAYKGIYPYASAGRDVKGVYVKIETEIDDKRYCGRCTPMRLLQVIRNTRQNDSGNLITADPENETRRERSGWNDADAPSRGWRVDRLTTATNPYYSSGGSGKEGSETSPAVLWDAPGNWSDATNSGKDFYTLAVCQDAAGRKWVAGYVHWGYYINNSGDVAFEPSAPTAACGYPQEAKDASDRWDAIAGNTATGISF